MTSKRYRNCLKLIDKDKQYRIDEALSLLKKMDHAKFDESVELSISLNIDPDKTEDVVRGTVILPHGTGKALRIAVFCKGEAEKQAREAGADFVGAAELVDKVAKGWCDFDVAVATPDLMREVSRLGKILGPKGLMPNPKAGTVTQDITKAVKEIKSGKIEFRQDKSGQIHISIGRLSFEQDKLKQNASSLLEAISHTKAASSHGNLIKNVTVSSTMSPGIKLNLEDVLKT